MEMLTGLSNSPQAAHYCFNLLKSTANGPVSWDHFFASIKQYYMDLRQDGGHAGRLLYYMFINILVFSFFFYNYACCLAWLFHNIAMSACNIYPVFQLPKSFLFLECITIMIFTLTVVE